jgi:hypothetical protein
MELLRILMTPQEVESDVFMGITVKNND